MIKLIIKKNHVYEPMMKKAYSAKKISIRELKFQKRLSIFLK